MIHDLCIIMLTAGITSLLFKLFKQPVVLGYIVAGMMAGPYLLGKSWISDTESVDTWGEIGVLFLLFAMGLEFSFKKLLRNGSSAVIAAMVIVVGMMSVGYLVGQLLGWSNMTSLFLGGMLCMSSTTIVFKAIEDMGLSKHHFVDVVFGILVIEDLFAVVLMVLLTSIAVKRSFEGTEMLMQIGKLLVYLILCFVLGIMIIPTFLKKFRKYLNDETLTILSIGLCLGMVMLATGAGFSAALGSFVMGSILAETLEAERIEHLVKPIKDVFGAIFFVSVGMMIDPSMLLKYWLPILILTLVIIVGQITFGTVGTLVSGRSLRVSLQTGFSLVQIGEFAFIIANLGQQLNVTQDFLYPIIVAVSVITTFLTPYIMKLAIPTLHFIENHSSDGMKMWLENYSKNRNTTVQTTSNIRAFFKDSIVSILIYSILTAFVYFVYFTYIHEHVVGAPLFTNYPVVGQVVAAAIVLGCSSPFILNIGTRHNSKLKGLRIWESSATNKAGIAAMMLLRLLICIAFISYAIASIFTFKTGALIGISVIVLFSILVSRNVKRRSSILERTFKDNLSARETSAEQKSVIKKKTVNSLLNYDIHISEFVVSADSSFCGKKLKSLHIRNVSGASIVSIQRGGVHIFIPGGDESLYPGDKIIAAGSDEQIDRLQKMLDKSLVDKDGDIAHQSSVSLENLLVTSADDIHGKTVSTCKIREKAQCIIMGIDREGKYFMNPDAQMEIKVGDTLILAGETARLKSFVDSYNNG